MADKLKITLVKSTLGAVPKHVKTVEALGLKKLIATSYASSPIVGSELNNYIDSDTELLIQNKKAYKVIMSELKDTNGDGREDLFDVQELIKHRIRYLKGDGDFRSDESKELLKQADIVVTNPPFSLFREYVSLLMEHKKKFVIIGSQNAIAYKEIFPLIKNNQLWLGNGFKAGNAFFKIPPSADNSKYASGVYNPETGLVKFRNCTWFTNLDIAKRHEILDLYKKYNEVELSDILNKLCNDDNVLRAKGFVDSGNEDWWYFDLVPGEFEIRLGKPIYTGQVCVIGKDLDENTIKELFLG